MHPILWRHAEAIDAIPDLGRELTRKGHRQANRIATWLNQQLPSRVRILASPARRAQQTASALADKFEIVESIAPGASAATILKVCDWPDAKQSVVLVGHQPTLGEAAALILTGKTLSWSIKKGAVWWFTHRLRDGRPQVLLRAVMSPEMLA